MDSQHPISTDTLIIGQGLAGSLLALELEHHGINYLIADDGWKSSSSTAAAGLINPVTGRRLVKSRGLERLLPAATAGYTSLEKQLKLKLLHQRPMVRLLRNRDDKAQLEKRLLEPDYRSLLGDYLSAEEMDPRLVAPLGGFEQFQAGFVDLPLLLTKLRQRFSTSHRLIDERIETDAIRLEQGGVRYREIKAQRIVFCDGYKAKDNPWFGHLPFQPDKGEILMLEFDRPLPKQIINGGEWLIPLDGDRYRLGSTHEHEQLDEQTTTDAQEKLLSALGKLIKSPPDFRIIEHRAGVRPATRGTQPFLGRHPDHHQLHIFNGFGAKGSLMIPWYAQRFADHLVNGEPLPKEADIRRFENETTTTDQ